MVATIAQLDSYNARVVLLTYSGIPLVKKYFSRWPLWKFPGGNSKLLDGGAILETARREVLEETDIDVSFESLKLIASRAVSKNHIVHLAFARVKREVSVPRMNMDEEYVELFTPIQIAELVASGEFLFEHVKLLKRAPTAYQNLIIPGLAE